MHVHRIRVQSQRLLECRQAFLNVSLIDLQNAQVMIALEIVRLEAQCRLEFRTGLDKVTALVKHEPQAVVTFRIVWLNAQRFVVALNGLLESLRFSRALPRLSRAST